MIYSRIVTFKFDKSKLANPVYPVRVKYPIFFLNIAKKHISRNQNCGYNLTYMEREIMEFLDLDHIFTREKY